MHSNFTGIARQLQFSSPFLCLNVSDIMKLILHSRAIAPSSRITPGNDMSICQNRRKCTEGSLNLFYTSGSVKGTKKSMPRWNKTKWGWDGSWFVWICWDWKKKYCPVSMVSDFRHELFWFPSNPLMEGPPKKLFIMHHWLFVIMWFFTFISHPSGPSYPLFSVTSSNLCSERKTVKTHRSKLSKCSQQTILCCILASPLKKLLAKNLTESRNSIRIIFSKKSVTS